MALTFATHDIVSDSPTNNFATMNPLAYRYGHNGIQYSNGNLRVVQGTSAISYATFTTKSGKWYWEIFIENNGTVANSDYRGLAEPVLGQSSDGWGNDCFLYNSYNGTYKIDAGSFTASDIGTANNPDIIGFFWDADNGYMTVSVNGVSGTTITGLSIGIPMCPAVACNYDTIDIINFGQDPTFAGNKNTPATVNINGTNVTGPFAPSGDAAGTAGLFYYPPPAGAKALCTANLPEMTPTVDDDTPQKYFKAVLYTGNNGTNNITDLEFQPDLVWIKATTDTRTHSLVDSVRGFNGSSAYVLQSDGTGGEFQSAYINSLDAYGFTVSGSENYINNSSHTYAAWCWKAGGAPTADNTATSGAMTANSVSLNGTLQSNYTPAGSPTIYPTRMSINTDAGFSIVKVTKSAAIYSYDTYPHGLSKAPDFIISKSLNASENWYCFHRSITPNNNYSARIQLNQPNQATLNSSIWGTPTNITDNIIAYDGHQYETIFYCWHSVEGYSKFGSYTGNGSADGPMVYCGFRPAFVMLKRTDASGFSWGIYDNKRPEYNEVNEYLLANSSLGTQSNNNMLDFLSNGIKMTTSDGGNNATNGTYIYAAFAEQPFKFSNAR